MYTGDVFDWLADGICEDCLVANENCMAGNRACRFSGYFDKLEAVCREAERLASDIYSEARSCNKRDWQPED